MFDEKYLNKILEANKPQSRELLGFLFVFFSRLQEKCSFDDQRESTG
jgi:hypothetical protein